eukprot:Tamp_19533.p1 GENE.Tamp_19533~~Tamp_19533.p1  ORF type:complete len:251 (-),score=32.51 Tamp_19533:205-957(-)
MAAQEVEVVESNEAAFRGKTVFIVRHAQGQHNVSPRFQFDPPLTDAGLKQVRRQKKVSSTLGVDLVLVSPLRRTLQTASGLFEEHPNMVALEDLREHVMESCNLREDTETLRTWFPNVNMQLIEEGPDKYLKRFEQPPASGDRTEIDCLYVPPCAPAPLPVPFPPFPPCSPPISLTGVQDFGPRFWVARSWRVDMMVVPRLVDTSNTSSVCVCACLRRSVSVRACLGRVRVQTYALCTKACTRAHTHAHT